MKAIFLILLLPIIGLTQDQSPHTSGFATVNGVKLHYLDWGGRGEAVLFITGMGDTAHVYDWMAPKFTDKYRVLALTRRGYGESDKPEAGYDADTLTEDVRRFLDHIKIKRVHLIGHSAAGNELTNFATRHPKRTLSLIYLDAAYHRADVPEIEKRDPLAPPEEPKSNTLRKKIDDIFATELFKYDPTYKKIKSPVLNFYAIFDKHWAINQDTPDDKKRAAEKFISELVLPYQRRNIAHFRRELPSARVIELTGTHHYFFRDPAKRDEVVITIREFLEAVTSSNPKSEFPNSKSKGKVGTAIATGCPDWDVRFGNSDSDWPNAGPRSISCHRYIFLD